MSLLVDQAERDRFIFEQGKNISVIAPAGVGKTTSIVERIVNLARLPEAQAFDRLSRLIVVTYSVRAAQQMQQKARVAIRKASVSPRVQRAFQQTFFGTIHSYCVRLLDRFGHYLGLPSSVTLLQADDELWNRFLIRGLGSAISSDSNLRDLFHFYPPEKLYALGKEISPGGDLAVPPLPALAAQRLLDYRDNTLHPSTMKSIVRAQDAVRQWNDAWGRGDRFRPLPKCPTSDKAADFAEIWRESFAPIHHWLRHAALVFGRRVANAYEAFRLGEAVMTYDDQVRMALQALEIPEVQHELALERLSVLLDEAQDTDPVQFKVLLRVAGEATRLLRQADDQTFCIVGDFQQAIYAPRSDLSVYQHVHNEIVTGPHGAESRLQVTFRCDQAIITFVNMVFPAVLNGLASQCAFVTLSPRKNAGPGQVVRQPCPELPESAPGEKISAEQRARHEARFVAQQLKELGPSGLGAASWAQVAVLCPRKNWLLDLQRELVALDLPVQLHSSNEQQGDRTPGKWLTALLWVVANPEDTFEIAGVLREIFGVPDHDMAVYTGGEGDLLRLDHPEPEDSSNGPVQVALRILREIRADADAIPLHQAVRSVLEKTQLRERLNSIPEMALESADRELDDLLAVIAGRGAEGITLAELAQELRAGLTQVYPAEEEIRNAIQLLTSHKSKGLEWDAVIVPYVFRMIESKAAPYPRLILREGGHEMVCRDKEDFAEYAREFVSNRDRQQLQRLLYVMCTRARRTLLLIDDEAVYAGQTRRQGWSAAELLQLGGANRDAWRELPETLAPAGLSEPEEPTPEPQVALLPALERGDFRRALDRAGAIPRRITPHALAVHRPDETEPEIGTEREEDQPPTAHHPGILYGTWWHEFVESIPWTQSAEAWQRKFDEALLRSPQPERAKREWHLFCHSPLSRWLAEPGRLIHVELPFLWYQPDRTCLEGVMDLAVYTAGEGTWRVIDWKTNRFGPEGGGSLVEVYRGQIRAYVQALHEMLATEVKGSLYLTQTGDWLEVD